MYETVRKKILPNRQFAGMIRFGVSEVMVLKIVLHGDSLIYVQFIIYVQSLIYGQFCT